MRPGFTCTAEITTATRAQAVAVPIQALTVRELIYDEKGNVVREPRPPQPRVSASAARSSRRCRRRPSTELLPGQKREEVEGVFVVRDGKAEFVPVKVGIAGERYFEVRRRPQGRRPRHHRTVRLGPQSVRRRSRAR